MRAFLAEIAESTLLGLLEPARAAFRRARDGTLARLHSPVNGNTLLLGCLDVTHHAPREHLLIGGAFRSPVRRLFDCGRVLFYLGENGLVKPFSLPSLTALLRQRGASC